MAQADIGDNVFSTRKETASDFLVIWRVLLQVGSLQFAREDRRTRDIEVSSIGSMTGLGHPVAALQVQLLNLRTTISSKVYTKINNDIALRAYDTFFRLSLALPATG